MKSLGIYLCLNGRGRVCGVRSLLHQFIGDHCHRRTCGLVLIVRSGGGCRWIGRKEKEPNDIKTRSRLKTDFCFITIIGDNNTPLTWLHTTKS